MSSLWFACSEPERPADPYVVWHYQDCPACRIKVQIVFRDGPDWAARIMRNLMGIAAPV